MAESAPIVGVDVGGTYTDAVCLQDGRVLQTAKEPTTRDVMSGVKNSLGKLMQTLRDNGHPTTFQQVNIGTTHFLNAVIQRRHLVPVSILRLCGTASTALEPAIDFPHDLKWLVYHSHYFLNGGFNFAGNAITPLDQEEILRIIADLRERNVQNIVVSCVFAPVNRDQELMVGKLIRERYPGASVTLSHEVGQMGLLERENAAILNESLKPLCRTTIGAFRRALAELDIACPFFMTQNDGTIVSSELALEYPVRTFSSGPTNSMRGAAYLSEVTQNAVVVDIGGTSTDVGYLMQAGFPRESSSKSNIAGVTTNFRMPDVKSIGLGGGSLVKVDGQNIAVGPRSVGYRLLTEALLFGGNTLTATDIAVAAGLADIEGAAQRVRQIPESLVTRAVEEMHQMLEEVIDQMKVSGEDVPVIVVGGGSILISESRGLCGASRVIKPRHYQSANAVGASLCKVSGLVDYVANVGEVGREAAIREAGERARQAAVRNGAEEATVEIIESESLGLAYMPGTTIRIRVKAVGEMARTQLAREPRTNEQSDKRPTERKNETQMNTQDSQQTTLPEDDGENDVEHWRMDSDDDSPVIDAESGEWLVSERDIEYMSIGAGLLGSGGGGSPYVGKLRALQQLRKGKKIRIIAPERLGTTPELEGLTVPLGFMGAPAVLIEKLMNGSEIPRAIACLQNVLQADPEDLRMQAEQQDPDDESKRGLVYIRDYSPCPTARPGKPLVAVMAPEIGGMNSMEPLVAASEMNLPVVDCDGMGRAFPELQMVTMAMLGNAVHPCVLVSDGSQQAVVAGAANNFQVEMCFRAIIGASGCASGLVVAPLSREDILTKTIPGSYSRIWHLGRLVARSARRQGLGPIDSIIQNGNGQLLIKGKITDVVRETKGGFDHGSLEVTGTGDHAGSTLMVSFQNENLIARRTDRGSNENRVVAMTPDLITVADIDKGHPIPTEEVQYGLRVAVITLPCPSLLQSPQVLRVVGPRAFGHDFDYVPVGEGVIAPPIPPLP